MDREYFEDYEQKEQSEFEKFSKRMQEDSFSFERDRYPPDERFVKLQKPVAVCTSALTSRLDNVWAQIPFSGSFILLLPPLPQHLYEKEGFKTSEIPKLVDLVKETGRLQIALNAWPSSYQGLDFLDPIFKELRPPFVQGAPDFIFGDEKELAEVGNVFLTLAKVKLLGSLKKESEKEGISPKAITELFGKFLATFAVLKLGKYGIAEEIENQIVDDPEKACTLLIICRRFISDPIRDLRFDLNNFAIEDIREAEILPSMYRPKEVRFPCEIGKFLLRKLTYAPYGLRACNELIDHYEAYDLQKVQKTLNEAITTNHPDIVNKSTEELSEILDNVWNDPEIPKLVKNLRRGIPMSIAAIGTAVSAFAGGLEGFLCNMMDWQSISLVFSIHLGALLSLEYRKGQQKDEIFLIRLLGQQSKRRH